MKYLFFDIECANCFDGKNKICEFGYVVCDDKFKVLKEENILINPQAPFDWYVLKKMLAYKKEDYLASPKYQEVFDKINSLFNEDTFVFGYSTDDDITYLNQESVRFNLPFIKCKFLDVAGIYTDLTQDKGKLAEVAKKLEVYNDEHEHRALDDAIMTMDILKKECEVNKLSLPNMVDKFYSYRGETENGSYNYPEEKFASAKKEHSNNMKYGSNNYKKFEAYVHNTKRNKEALDNPLKNKRIIISQSYEKKHYKEMLAIVKILADLGAIYTQKIDHQDYYVKYDDYKEDGSLRRCMREEYIKKNTKECKDIKVISFEEFLKFIGKSEEELSNIELQDL